MSVYKGTQLIATNGMPGAPGKDGKDGGLQIVSGFTELHNNIDYDGKTEQTNNSLGASWCSVGGYRCGVQGGQGSFVYGYNCVGSGSGITVFGYGNTGNRLDQGTFVEGCENVVNHTNMGNHIEGWNNTISDINPVGAHIEGAEHSYVIVDAFGGHQGGDGITANTPMLKLPYQRAAGGYQSTILEAIGLPNKGPNGEYARIVRSDGSMAINGDMSFVATDSSGQIETDSNHPDGVYTLGEIVKALHDAGITIPKNIE